MATLYSDYNVCIKLSIVFAILLKLLSSANLSSDAIKIVKKNWLNSVGPTIEPS